MCASVPLCAAPAARRVTEFMAGQAASNAAPAAATSAKWDIVSLDVTIFVLVSLDVPLSLDVAKKPVLSLDVANKSIVKFRRTQQFFVKFRRSDARAMRVEMVQKSPFALMTERV